jgi:hypothetical protein
MTPTCPAAVHGAATPKFSSSLIPYRTAISTRCGHNRAVRPPKTFTRRTQCREISFFRTRKPGALASRSLAPRGSVAAFVLPYSTVRAEAVGAPGSWVHFLRVTRIHDRFVRRPICFVLKFQTRLSRSDASALLRCACAPRIDAACKGFLSTMLLVTMVTLRLV